MSNLFKKVAIFSDIHFGRKANSIIANSDNLDFIEWFCKKAQEENCETCLFLGDYTHNRNNISLPTLTACVDGMKLLSKSFEKVLVLIGNHDTFEKTSRKNFSLCWADNLPNITVINDITKIGNCILAPWLVGDEQRHLFAYEGDYLFGHLEIPGFIMSGTSVMPDGNGLTLDKFKNFGKVFTGHFHKRQKLGHVQYIGSTFPTNFGDAWEEETRGMMVLEYGKKEQYYSWPESPVYRTCNLSDLVVTPEVFLLPKSYVRVTLNNDVSYEESQYLREALLTEYEVRELSLVSLKKDLYADDLALNSNVAFQSVDDIIVSQLSDIKSEFYNSSVLLDIYRKL